MKLSRGLAGLAAAAALAAGPAWAPTGSAPPAAGKTMTPYVYLHDFDVRLSGGNQAVFLADARDATLDARDEYDGLWSGKPYYEYLVWCSAEFEADTNPELPSDAKARLADQVFDDARERYEADRGTAFPADAMALKREDLALLMTVGAMKRHVGIQPDSIHCARADREYQARFHPAPATAAAPAPASQASAGAPASDPLLAYADMPGDPLTMDEQDQSIAAGLGAWSGRRWTKALAWCEAVTLAEYNRTGSQDPDIRAKILPYYATAMTRLVGDHGIPPEAADKLIGAEVNFLGSRMAADGFTASARGQEALRACPELPQAYLKTFPPQ
jgi:hypothetical protein